jgi:hypothetical protein
MPKKYTSYGLASVMHLISLLKWAAAPHPDF